MSAIAMLQQLTTDYWGDIALSGLPTAIFEICC